MKYIRAAETDWERNNPILDDDERGLISGTNYYVQGDGETPFNDLDRIALSDGPTTPGEDLDIDAIREALEADFISTTEKGAASGVATLDAQSDIPDSAIPDTIARDTETDARYSYTLAYAEDISNTSTALTVGQFTPTACTISVPPTTRDVNISWGGAIAVSVAGPGTINLGVMDVTSGVVTLYSGTSSNTGTLAAGIYSTANYLNGQVNVGASTSWRIFKVYGFLGRDSGSMAGSIAGSGASPYSAKTWIKAVVE